MKVIYIVGPYSASSPEGVEANIKACEDLAFEVWRLGMAAICVNSMGRNWDGVDPSRENVMKASYELITRVDALLAAPGWEKSSGTTDEIKFARSIGKHVFFCIEDLIGI